MTKTLFPCDADGPGREERSFSVSYHRTLIGRVSASWCADRFQPGASQCGLSAQALLKQWLCFTARFYIPWPEAYLLQRLWCHEHNDITSGFQLFQFGRHAIHLKASGAIVWGLYFFSSLILIVKSHTRVSTVATNHKISHEGFTKRVKLTTLGQL